MTALLLVLILLVLVFPRFLQALGVLIWIIAGLLWLNWPTEAEQKARIEPTPAPAVEMVTEQPPPRSPNELDFRPTYRPDGKPPSRIQR